MSLRCVYVLILCLEAEHDPSSGMQEPPTETGKSESPSTTAWITDVPDTPGRQAPKYVTDTLQESKTKSITA